MPVPSTERPVSAGSTILPPMDAKEVGQAPGVAQFHKYAHARSGRAP